MYDYRLGLLFLAVIFLLSPIVMDWWATSTGDWYRPFLIWLVFIISLILLTKSQGNDEL